MFCPNCGTRSTVDQHFCRDCGLQLDAVVAAVSEQYPSEEYAELQRREETKKRIGVACLAIAGIIGFSMLLFRAAQYKLALLGEDVLFWSAGGALILFLILSVIFLTYPTGVKSRRGREARETDETQTFEASTRKLIDERPFEPASSVTDSTTEVLEVPRVRRK